MAKINITKLQHQEKSENTTPNKPKVRTKKESSAEGYDKDVYPIIYCLTHRIIRNLAHGRMNCKLPRNTHKKEATLFNQMSGSANPINDKLAVAETLN